MNTKEFIKDINSEFGLRSFLTNRLGDRLDHDKILCTSYRPMKERGRDQIFCLIAHYLAWKRRGTTQSYCWECPHFVKMTCMESAGYSEECGRGHYRFEAT